MMNHPLKVTHVIKSLAPHAGGPPIICTSLATAQAQRGHQVNVVTQELDSTETDTSELKPYNITPCKPVGFLNGCFSSKTAQRFREILDNSDVIHLHGVWDGLLLAAGRAAQTAGIPYILIPHGMLDPWSLAQKQWKKKLALKLGTQRLLRRTAAFHLGTPHEIDSVQQLHLTNTTYIIPNGVDLIETDKYQKNDIAETINQQDRVQRTTLFLSRIHYKKGLDILAEAFAEIAAKHPDVTLVVAGPDGGEEANFRQAIRRLGIDHRVQMVGPLYGEKKWAALTEANCFVLPSRQEGFSMAILEALASSIPVVITHECHFPEVAEVNAGEVVAVNAAEIAGALDRILSNPQAAMTMGAAGRTLVEHRYTWDAIAEQCDNMYMELLGRNVAKH